MVQIPVSHSSMVKRAPDLTRRVKNDMTLQGDKILQCINAAALYDMPIRDYMIKNKLHFVPIEIVEDIASRYRDYKIVNCLYDYTDMLIMAKTNELNLPEWDYLFVDEAQDLSTLQWLLVDRMAAVTKNIIIAGDDKQCQPPGSKVLTTNGFKFIEDLDETKDKLVSYARRDAMCYGGYSFKKEVHRYDGYMYTLHTKVGDIKTTRGHINLVKWNNKDTSKNVVYLMQRGEYFRIGWCQLFNSNGGLHLGERSHKEKADKTWILKVCDSKQEASKYESIFAAKYGLPLVPFEPPYNTYYYTKEALEDIFKSVPCQKERAVKLLDDLNKSIYDPFLQKGKQNRHGATIFECTSLNLEEGLMKLPVMKDKKHIEWVPIDEISLTGYSGLVYGLDVEKHHTYITDNNIITHNCINEFAGADVDTFLTIPGKVQVLDQSYRTPRAIYNLSNGLMNRMVKYRPEGAKWKPRAVKGFVKRCKNLLPLKEMRTGEWLVLARAAFQLEHIREQLIRDCEFGALLFTINGSAPIDLDVFRVISMFKMSDIQGKEILLDAVTIKDEHTADERKQRMEYIQMFKKYISCDADRKLQPWEVTPAFVKKLSLPWAEAMDKIPTGMLRYISKVYPLYLKKGDKLFEDAQIRLMTIHASKGREATNVLLVADIPRTVSNNLRFEHDDTEIKVLYVAITRTKENLYIYTKNPKYISYEDFL